MTGDINQAIQQIAEGLGVTVDALYPILYKQAFISGFMNLVWAVVWTLIIVAYVIFLKTVIKKQKADDYYGTHWDWDEAPILLPTIFGGILSVIAVFIVCAMIEGSVTAFLNPEYFMIDKILSKLN